MALRSGYKGFKKLLGLKMIRPGTLAVDDTVLANTFFPRSEQAVLGAKNLAPITLASIKALNSSRTWDGNVTTHNGVTYTVNTDASGYLTSIETSGTATGYSFLRLCSVSQFNGSFILNGGVDSGKFAYIQNETTNTGLAYSYGADSDVVNLSPTANTVNCIIAYNQGASGAGTFKPMIRLSTDTDPTYAPFAMTNRELTEKKADLSLLQKNIGSVSDLNNIPFGLGYADLQASVSPTGSVMQTNYVCFGISSFKTLIVYWGDAHKICVNRYSNNAWSGWYAVELSAVTP